MQKKSTFFIVFLFASAISMAQFEKGTVTTNFNIGDIRSISIRNKPMDTRNSFSFNPGIGYFINNNWEVGIGLNYSSFRIHDSIHGGPFQDSRTLGANIYTNYYFGNGKFKPYFSFQMGWNNWKGTYSSGTNLNSFNNIDLYYGIGAGVNWNISSRFALFAEGSFIRDRPFNRYGLGRPNITIGARFFFHKRRK